MLTDGIYGQGEGVGSGGLLCPLEVRYQEKFHIVE